MDIKEELHTLIIWSEANELNDKAATKIQSHFELIATYSISWDKNRFIDNLKVFYSHSQKHCSDQDYNAILENKIKHCGNDSFTLYIYKDHDPIYDFRTTSGGNRKVNINVFDLKASLRVLSGGGHKIHASDNTFESNKDLTLLFGMNSADFLKIFRVSDNRDIIVRKNCVGVGGYDSIEELFYVLNNSLNYCVLRNFECFPEEYTFAEHGDIDLLVEDLNYIKYLTLAKPYYPDLNYRVHYGIVIGRELIPFDFRYLGDNYYDFNWQNSILQQTVLYKGIAKVPDETNHFYSLLYHAYVQKREVKSDYKKRLQVLAKTVGINYRSELSNHEVKLLLDFFLSQNKYYYTIPLDKTVLFNSSFTNSDASRSEQFGKILSIQPTRLDDEVIFTEVYDNGSEITKFGSKMIIENEIKYLAKLAHTNLVPKIIKTSLEENNCFVVMEKLEGQTLGDVKKDKRLWTVRNIKSTIAQLVNLNEILIEYQISHRDVRPENFMVTFDKNNNISIKWIDFGWSVDFGRDKNLSNPIGLGGKFKYKEGQFSDLYSTGRIITKIFEKLSFKSSINKLFHVDPVIYNLDNSELLNIKIANIKNINSYVIFTWKDYIKILLIRNKSLLKVAKRIKKTFS